MAVLDFPNAPTVGATYTAPNGAVYTWDGAAWTVSGVLSTGSAAGGSLAGTYPNPTIAASKVRGTPSSGGTAREIAKASLWGGDDLIDLSVPTAKLGTNAPVPGAVRNAISASATAGTTATLLSATLTGYRGGWVLMVLDVGGIIAPADTALSRIVITPVAGAAAGTGRPQQFIPTSGMVATQLPWSFAASWLVTVAAGTTVFAIQWVLTNGTATWRADSAELSVIGFA